MMALVLRVCREYGQPKTWFESLPAEDRALYIADALERDRKTKR